jgi:hypothetical protein
MGKPFYSGFAKRRKDKHFAPRLTQGDRNSCRDYRSLPSPSSPKSARFFLFLPGSGQKMAGMLVVFGRFRL